VLLFLQKHPGAPPNQWPGAINWHCFVNLFNDSAWTTVERSNIADLMPQAEIRRVSIQHSSAGHCC
jgi:hypothetical protein